MTYSFPNLKPVHCSMCGSDSSHCFLTCTQISQEADKVVWYPSLFKNFPLFVVIHTVKGFSVVSEAKVYVFLKFSCFFDDPTDVGNLISGSSTFSKSSLNIWKFLAHILLKPSLENFEHYLYEKRPHSVRHIWVSVFISLLICCIALGKLLKCSEHRLPLL